MSPYKLNCHTWYGYSSLYFINIFYWTCKIGTCSAFEKRFETEEYTLQANSVVVLLQFSFKLWRFTSDSPKRRFRLPLYRNKVGTTQSLSSPAPSPINMIRLIHCLCVFISQLWQYDDQSHVNQSVWFVLIMDWINREEAHYLNESS